MKRKIFKRDGGHCRFCGIPLIDESVRDRILKYKIYSDVIRWQGWKDPERHRGLLCLWAQYDHIDIWKQGGATSLENLVLACYACNYGRNRKTYTLAEFGLIDPRPPTPLRDAQMPGWDGLERFR